MPTPAETEIAQARRNVAHFRRVHAEYMNHARAFERLAARIRPHELQASAMDMAESQRKLADLFLSVVDSVEAALDSEV